MQKQNLSIVYGETMFTGFNYEDLPLAAAVLAAAQQIDLTADQARASVVVDALRVVEYEMAEREAQAFKAAGYQGTVPPTVQAQVDAAGVNPQEAADSILVEAAAWRGALYEIRAARLKGKQSALKAETHAEAELIADTAIAAIRASVKGVGNAQ